MPGPGHGLQIRTNRHRETWAACTCGWETVHAWTGDARFVDAAARGDWDQHAVPSLTTARGLRLAKATRTLDAERQDQVND